MGEKYIISTQSDNYLESIVNEFYESIDSTKKFMGIVAGSLNAQVFDNKMMIDGINHFLKKEGELYLIFKGDDYTWFRDNKSMGLTRLLFAYSESIKINSVKFMPEMQYIVTDTRVLMSEKPTEFFPSFQESLIVKDDIDYADDMQMCLKEMYDLSLGRNLTLEKK